LRYCFDQPSPCVLLHLAGLGHGGASTPSVAIFVIGRFGRES
jgi:hypothetical protein